MIYCMQKLWTPKAPIKIGCSCDVARRRITLEGELGLKFEILGVLPGGEEKELEIHGRFAKYSIDSEWFVPSKAIRAFIKSEMLPWEKTPRTFSGPKARIVSYCCTKEHAEWVESLMRRGGYVSVQPFIADLFRAYARKHGLDNGPPRTLSQRKKGGDAEADREWLAVKPE